MVKKHLIIVLIIVLFINFQLLYGTSEDMAFDSKSTETDENENRREPLFKALLKDEGEIWTSPFRFSLKDWGIVAGISLITGYMIKNDESIYARFKSYQAKNKWVDDLSPITTLLGDGNVSLGISGLFYLSGIVFKDSKAKNTAGLVLMSLVHSGIVVQMVKHLTGRQRPEAENGVDKWSGPSAFFTRYKDHSDMYYDSFFSGHTITVWSTATVIAHQYNKSFVIPAISYGLATLSGLSRVTEDKHWLSDVFVGAVLGFAIGKFVYKKRSNKFMMIPLTGNGKIGLSLGVKI